MTLKEQRIAIANAVGDFEDLKTGRSFKYARAYPKSLDAMHEAEKVLNAVRLVQFVNELRRLIIHRSPIVSCDEYELIHATAAQRAEAFLRTLSLWKE